MPLWAHVYILNIDATILFDKVFIPENQSSYNRITLA